MRAIKHTRYGVALSAAMLAVLLVVASAHTATAAQIQQPVLQNATAGVSAHVVQSMKPATGITYCGRYDPALHCDVKNPAACSTDYNCAAVRTIAGCPVYECVPYIPPPKNPQLTMQSTSVQQGFTDKIAGTATSPGDQIELEVNGIVVAGPSTGYISYTLAAIDYSPGSYVVSANDITSATASTATLTVTAPPPLTCSNACYTLAVVTAAHGCPSSCPAVQSSLCSANEYSCTGTPAPAATNCGLLPPGLAHNITINAPWYCPINQQMYNAWEGDLPIALIVVMIAFLIAGSIFAVGAGLKNDRVRNYGIGEMYEATASAILIGIFLYVSAVMFGLLPSAIIGPINPYATALNLMTSTISAAENVYTSLYHVYYYYQLLSSVSVNVVIPDINGKIPVQEVLLAPLQLYWDILVIEPTVVISSFITDGILALYAEYNLIVFFSLAAIPAFLIPGIIFRAIIPTRALGGIMIALAMGFYFIMPTLFAVAYYFTAPHMTTLLNDAALQLSRFSLSKSSFNTQINPSSPIVTQISGVKTAFSGFWLLILFYPTLIVAITYAFVVQVADLIGGASRMGGKVRGFI